VHSTPAHDVPGVSGSIGNGVSPPSSKERERPSSGAGYHSERIHYPANLPTLTIMRDQGTVARASDMNSIVFTQSFIHVSSVKRRCVPGRTRPERQLVRRVDPSIPIPQSVLSLLLQSLAFDASSKPSRLLSHVLRTKRACTEHVSLTEEQGFHYDEFMRANQRTRKGSPGMCVLIEHIREECGRHAWYGQQAEGPAVQRVSADDPRRSGFAWKPATARQLRDTTQALAFSLPPLLSALYQDLANGRCMACGERLGTIHQGKLSSLMTRKRTLQRSLSRWLRVAAIGNLSTHVLCFPGCAGRASLSLSVTGDAE
jgi:hypothetical protein